MWDSGIVQWGELFERGERLVGGIEVHGADDSLLLGNEQLIAIAKNRLDWRQCQWQHATGKVVEVELDEPPAGSQRDSCVIWKEHGCLRERRVAAQIQRPRRLVVVGLVRRPAKLIEPLWASVVTRLAMLSPGSISVRVNRPGAAGFDGPGVSVQLLELIVPTKTKMTSFEPWLLTIRYGGSVAIPLGFGARAVETGSVPTEYPGLRNRPIDLPKDEHVIAAAVGHNDIVHAADRCDPQYARQRKSSLSPQNRQAAGIRRPHRQPAR